MIRFCLRLLLLLGLLAGAGPAVRAQRHFLKHFGPAEGFAPSFVYALHQDRQGYLWAATAEGIVRYDGTEFVTFTTRQGLAEDFATKLYEDTTTHTLWVNHYQGGVSRWDGQRFRKVGKSDKLPAGFAASTGVVAPDTSGIRRYQQRFGLTEVPDVTGILVDQEGNAWLGTAGQGLWRHSDRHLRLAPARVQLSGTALTAATRLGQPLFGTSRGQLFAPIPPLSFSAVRLPGPITALAYASAGHDNRKITSVWAGTAGQGVWRVTATQAQRLEQLPPNLHVTALAWQPDSSLWVGTEADGVYHCSADARQPTRHYTTATGLLHNAITALLCDAAGRVWIGTHDTGLAVWQAGRFTYHRFRGGIDVNDFAAVTPDTVWVGTNGQGLLCYAGGRFRQYTTADGLASNYCYAVVPFRHDTSRHHMFAGDSRHHDYLLLVHQNQLTAFDPLRQRARPLASPGNPLVQHCRPLVSVYDFWHRLYVDTDAGLLQIDVNEDAPRPTIQPPRTVVAQAEVDGAARNPATLAELPAGTHRLGFRFRGISLLPRLTGLQHQYRLRGYLDEWSQPTALAEAQFPRLDAGRYVLEVRARLSPQDAWGPPARVPFSIATPFWRTWWFAALLLLTAVAAVWAFIRTREATLRRQKLQLELTVRERTQELRQQKAHIEQINADLVVARDAAEASRRAKAQFLANMSHEIRTPMNAVIGLTHLLQRTPATAEQREYLEAVQGSSQNLLTIINDILDSSKIEAGKLTLERAPFALRGLLQRVARMFEFATVSKGLQLHLALAPEVPAAVLGDSVRLNQVLVNLLGNAIKFTAAGHVTLRVTAAPAAAPDAWQVRFAVQDTGIGIPADKLDAIFEDFSQANASTTRQFGGTGLGLSIARNLVELHGGRLWVESTVGEGSTFFFELPYPAADPADLPADTPTELTPFEPPLRVLVAEDNDLNQLVARKTLEAWNVQVTLAANGRLAVAAAEATAFDAVLMDVQMPEMDGYEAARQLRQRFPDALPIIGLTASALPEDRALALAAGMNDTLPKPFDPAVLYARLAHFTGRQAPSIAPAAVVSAPSIPAPGATAETPDWSLLEELAFGNEAFIAQIIDTFLREAPPLSAQLTQAALDADAPALGSVAHRLKGQVAYFGLPGLHARLDALEQLARTAALTDATAAAAAVAEALAALYPALQHRRQIPAP